MSSAPTNKRNNARRRGRKSGSSKKENPAAKHTVGTTRAQQNVAAKDRKIRELRAALQWYQFDHDAQSRRVKCVLETEMEQPPLPSMLNPIMAVNIAGVEARADLLEQGILDSAEQCDQVCRARDAAKNECFDRYEAQLKDLDQAEDEFRAKQEIVLQKYEKARKQLLTAYEKQCTKIDDWGSERLANCKAWVASAQEELDLLRGKVVRKEKIEEEGDEELRRELCCPLTHSVMVDPVLTVDGYTYERAAIEQWFAQFPLEGQNPRCPRTNVTLSSRELIPNVGLKSLCDVYRRRNGLS